MDRLRLDKWLWAARFFKTRALAAEAIDIGRVSVNAERVKRSRDVRVGDTVAIRRPPYEQQVVVRGISEQRGPAVVAQTLYAETEASAAARAKLSEQFRAAGPAAAGEAGKPSKRDRRALDRVRGRDA